MTLKSPLDLEYWFVNVFSGNWEIFIFISVIAIMALAARFRMPDKIAIIMLALFVIMLSQYMGVYYIFALAIGGIITFLILSKPFK